MRPANAEGEDSGVQLVRQSCQNNLCEALAEIEEDSLAAVAAEGVTVVASYQPSSNNQPIVFSFGLSGVLEGMDAVLPRPWPRRKAPRQLSDAQECLCQVTSVA